MKKLTTVSLFIFWAMVTAILTAGLLSYQNQRSNSPMLAVATSSAPAPVSTGAVNTTSPILTVAEVAKHDLATDCWTIIDGNVYNTTPLISIHSGGSDAILRYCGKDGTVAFQTKDGRGSHSASAQSMLTQLYVGRLGTPAKQTSPVGTNTSRAPLAPVIPSQDRGDD